MKWYLTLSIVLGILLGIGLIVLNAQKDQSPAWPSVASVQKPALSPKNIKVCAGLEVHSLELSSEGDGREWVAGDWSPKMTIVPGNVVTVIAIGPPLGSMDSPKVSTELRCTATGIILTVNLTRSADYHGAALQNVLWRPRIESQVVLRQAEATFQTIWIMRLTTGATVDHAQTPPYPSQTYPITVIKTIQYAP